MSLGIQTVISRAEACRIACVNSEQKGRLAEFEMLVRERTAVDAHCLQSRSGGEITLIEDIECRFGSNFPVVAPWVGCSEKMVIAKPGIYSRAGSHIIGADNQPFLPVGGFVQLLDIFDAGGEAAKRIEREFVGFVLTEKPGCTETYVVFAYRSQFLRQFRIFCPESCAVLESRLHEKNVSQRILERSSVAMTAVTVGFHPFIATDFCLCAFAQSPVFPNLLILPWIVV